MHQARSARGFTLLEVMIAATILGGVVLLVASTVTRTQVAGRSGELDQHAHTLANNALESVRALVASGATCDQLRTLQPTDTRYRGTIFTTTTALDFVRQLDTTSSVLAANSVACEDSRAVRVRTTVAWPDPLEASRTRSYDLATSVRTVDLRAPADPSGPSAVTVEPLQVAHQGVVTLRWSEGDALPIPNYLLTHPESRVAASDPAPTSVPSVAWDGPAPWLGSPNERALEVPTGYGDPLALTVTRARANTLTFRAQRDGEHQLTVRNVVGGTTHTLPINVVMKPRVAVGANPGVIVYGTEARLVVANPAPWDGHDAQARLVIAGANNPHSNSDAALSGLTTGREFRLAAPTVFPAVYDARATNLWTATYHGANSAPEGVDLDLNPYTRRPTVQCYGPTVASLSGPGSAEAGETLTISVAVDSRNVPDGTVTLYRDGSAVESRELAFPGGAQTHTFTLAAGSAGTRSFEARVDSPMCRDEADDRASHQTTVQDPEPDPGESSGDACGTLSVSNIRIDRDWNSSASAYLFTLRYDVTYSWGRPDRPPDRFVDGEYIFAEYASTNYSPGPPGTIARSRGLGAAVGTGEITEGPFTMSEQYVYAAGDPPSVWVVCDTNAVTFGYGD
jgi:prepilin-type N-terminal cleavage/methylation domain-containing protein